MVYISVLKFATRRKRNNRKKENVMYISRY